MGARGGGAASRPRGSRDRIHGPRGRCGRSHRQARDETRSRKPQRRGSRSVVAAPASRDCQVLSPPFASDPAIAEAVCRLRPRPTVRTWPKTAPAARMRRSSSGTRRPRSSDSLRSRASRVSSSKTPPSAPRFDAVTYCLPSPWACWSANRQRANFFSVRDCSQDDVEKPATAHQRAIRFRFSSPL